MTHYNRRVAYSDDQKQEAIRFFHELRTGHRSDRQTHLAVSERTGVAVETIRRWMSSEEGQNAGLLNSADDKDGRVHADIDDDEFSLEPNSLTALADELVNYVDHLGAHSGRIEASLTGIADLAKAADSGDDVVREGITEDELIDALTVELVEHQIKANTMLDSLMSLAVSKNGRSLTAIASLVGLSPTGVRGRVLRFDLDRMRRIAGPLQATMRSLGPGLAGCAQESHIPPEVMRDLDRYLILAKNYLGAMEASARWLSVQEASETSLPLLKSLSSLNAQVARILQGKETPDQWEYMRKLASLDVQLEADYREISASTIREKRGRASRPVTFAHQHEDQGQ